MVKLIVALGLVAAACGGGDKKAAPTGPTVPDPAGDRLGLAEMKIMDTKSSDAVLIHADGNIEVGGKVLAKVTTDGKLIRTDTNEVVMELQADGTITAKDGIPPVKIADDGSVTLDGKTVSIDATGNLVGANPEGPSMKIEGATTAAHKRTAMFVLLALTMPGDPQKTGEAGPTPAPPADQAKPPTANPMPK